MPIFLPMIAFLHSLFTSCQVIGWLCANMTPTDRLVEILLRSEFDLDVNASGEFQTHQSLNGLIGGTENIDQSLVGSHLELFTAVLILMNSAQDRDDLLFGRQRNGPRDAGAGALRGLQRSFRRTGPPADDRTP